MPKSKFYIRIGSSRQPFGYTIMQRKAHWWQRQRKVADFPSSELNDAMILCYQLNHQGQLPPVVCYSVQPDLQEQHIPTDPEYSYRVCAECAIPHGEEEGTYQLMPPPILPLRDGEPMRVTDVRYHTVSISIAEFIDEDEQYAKLCAQELVEHLCTAAHDRYTYIAMHSKKSD